MLGIEIELEAREHKVGKFSRALIGRLAGSERQDVIIENQFGETDHTHLGQVLTYAGGTDPTVVIWIAERFRDEHRAALDWLNHNTHPEIRFFGVRLGVVRMQGASEQLVAPLFELVCKPNDWEKLAKLESVASSTGAGLSSSSQLYKRYWEEFAKAAYERGWTNATPPSVNWWDLRSGTTGVTWGVSYSQFGARSELHFAHPDEAVHLHRLNVLEGKAEQLQELFGEGDLIFDDIPGKKATRIDIRLDGPKVANEQDWPEVLHWMVDTQERLRVAVKAVGGIPISTS